MPYLLCVDLGTSTCKSIVYDLELNAKGRGYEEIRTAFPKPRWAEQRPEEWWSAARAAMRQSIRDAGIGPEDVVGAAFCGQGHGPVLLGEGCKALLPCIIWPDLRAVKQAETIRADLRREVAAYYTPAKMLWIKENRPEAFGKMRKFVLPKDYVRMRMSGTVLTDPGDASGTMMYSTGNSWDYALVDYVGIPREKLPEVRRSEEVVGEVTREASAETGLKAGTPVIAGTADYVCTRLALGGYLEPRRAVVYLGSAPSIFTVRKDGKTVGGFMGIGGASLKWFKEQLRDFGAPKVSCSYEALDKEAEKAEPGSGGVLFLPHMMGERNPAYDPSARGVLFGLSLGHRSGEVVRGMMEGVVFQLRLILEGLIDDGKPEEVLVIGGGAKSRVWVQAVADIFGAEACVPRVEEVGTLGLAALLLSGLGFGEGVREAQEKLVKGAFGRARPRPGYRDKYDELFALYRDLEKALSAFYKRADGVVGIT